MRYDKKIRRDERLNNKLTSCQSELEHLQSSHQHLKNVVEGLMHETRRFNAEIQGYTNELANEISKNESANPRIKDLTDTIYYTSGLLASRMTFSDFELNPQLVSKQQRLRTGIYKKFDKARYILLRQARQKNIDIRFIGNSVLEIDALQAFELVPFVILDNAVKYSPDNQDITINFDEIKNKELEVIISSIGPQLRKDEYARIFERGTRGVGASKIVAGEGLGLYLAMMLCRLDNIEISADTSKQQNSCYRINNIEYAPFDIILRVKRH